MDKREMIKLSIRANICDLLSQVEPYPKHINEVICSKYTVARAYMNNAIMVLHF